jgi:proteasome lid subunit RPN8/RPN11
MRVLMEKQVAESLLVLARARHPNEAILLLRGKLVDDDVHVEDVVIPPFGSGGRGFAHFPSHALPIDFSIVGTAHSHPTGNPQLSNTDLHNFYSRIMVIAARPYRPQDIAAYNKRGESIPIEFR